MSLEERRPGETEFQYHRRLVYGKLVDKTLSDMDYSEFAIPLYGYRYSSDVTRRMMYGSRYTLQVLDREIGERSGSTNISLLTEGRQEKGPEETSVAVEQLRKEREELAKERRRLYDQRREHAKLVTHDGRFEHLAEQLLKAAEKLPDLVSSPDHSYTDKRSEYGSGGPESPTEAVLVLCDWHYGMTTDNAWNKYDTSICVNRVDKVVNSTIERLRRHRCSKLHVLVLGDLIHGAIHTSARVASEELVCEQLMHASELLARSINRMSEAVEEVEVSVTYGNHARTVQNKSDNIHRDNMERIIPWWLAQRLRANDKVSVLPESEDEFLFVDVLGYGVCASHGDLDSLKSSPMVISTLFHKKFRKDVDYVLIADKHHRESTYESFGVPAMICGALCGTDEYANSKRLYSTPEQLLLVFDTENGVDAEYHLKCD